MTVRAFVHLSDLHIGRSYPTHRSAVRLRDMVGTPAIDHIVVTGDVTHQGRDEQHRQFERIFAPLRGRDCMTVIPGNHDRMGDGVATRFMSDRRVMIRRAAGLFMVCLDSTGPHNRSWLASHGMLTVDDIALAVNAVDHAPAGDLVALLMHHHPLPLPFDRLIESLSDRVGWRWATEIERGPALMRALRGRCDLVLHGHKHVPRKIRLFEDDERPLTVFNAGSSTELGQARVFLHENGRLLQDPTWMSSAASGQRAGSDLSGDHSMIVETGPGMPANRKGGAANSRRGYFG